MVETDKSCIRCAYSCYLVKEDLWCRYIRPVKPTSPQGSCSSFKFKDNRQSRIEEFKRRVKKAKETLQVDLSIEWGTTILHVNADGESSGLTLPNKLLTELEIPDK